ALRDAIKTRRAMIKKGMAPAKGKSHSSEARKLQHQRPSPDAPESTSSLTQASFSQEVPQQQMLTSSPAPISHPSEPQMLLVPFMDQNHRTFGDFEPRPLSLPTKLGDFFFNTLSDPNAQQRNASDANAWLNSRGQQNDAAAAMNASLSNILVQNAGNTGNFASLLAPGVSNGNNLFANAPSNIALPPANLLQQQPSQQHLPTAYANAGLAQLFGSLDGATETDSAFPSIEQQQQQQQAQQQMLSSILGSRAGLDPLHNLPQQQPSLSHEYTLGNGGLPNSLLGSTIQPLDTVSEATTAGAAAMAFAKQQFQPLMASPA
ncbi:MAG: hypothetical protein SGILL_008925, partial [Bacillariaceae sp.]